MMRLHTECMDKLISYQEFAEIFGISRDKAKAICKKMPHIVIGHKGTGPQIRVLSSHAHALVNHMALEKVDLTNFIDQATETEIISIISIKKDDISHNESKLITK